MSLNTLASWSSLPLVILFALKSATSDPEPATPAILTRDGGFYLAEHEAFHFAVFWDVAKLLGSV